MTSNNPLLTPKEICRIPDHPPPRVEMGRPRERNFSGPESRRRSDRGNNPEFCARRQVVVGLVAIELALPACAWRWLRWSCQRAQRRVA